MSLSFLRTLQRKTGRFPGTASSPRTATRRKTDRFSGRFKAVGFESLPNGVARH